MLNSIDRIEYSKLQKNYVCLKAEMESAEKVVEYEAQIKALKKIAQNGDISFEEVLP